MMHPMPSIEYANLPENDSSGTSKRFISISPTSESVLLQATFLNSLFEDVVSRCFATYTSSTKELALQILLSFDMTVFPETNFTQESIVN